MRRVNRVLHVRKFRNETINHSGFRDSKNEFMMLLRVERGFKQKLFR